MNLVRETMSQHLTAKKQHNNLKLILMSATISQQLFANYFAFVNSIPEIGPAVLQANSVRPCPCINVPTSLFDVQEFFLEDALSFYKKNASPKDA